jgi:hypothetical protein
MPQNAQPMPSAAEIESLFNGITAALRVSVKLNEMKMASDGRWCLIRSHDAYGRLPDIQISFPNDRENSLDLISVSIARLGMVVRFRQELAELYCGCRFLLPITQRKAFLVGVRAGGKIIMAKGPDPCRAYQELKKAADISLKTYQLNPDPHYS